MILAHELLKRRRTFRYWRELDLSQWLSTVGLQSRQLASLKRLLHHAAGSCPYYRQTWRESGLEIHESFTLDDFLRWPLITRETIRAHRPAMRSGVLRTDLIHKATGGSSGVPLQFDLDRDSNDRRMAAWHRGYAWAGAAPGTKQLYFWGVPLGERPQWRVWKDAAYNALYRRKVINCFEYRDQAAPAIARQIATYRPQVIVAYTNPLYFLARSLDEQGIVPFSPHSIVVGAEKLHDFQRATIESVFRCPVFETYGSREFMLIGAECERHAGLHLTAEHLLVEILDEDGRPTPAGDEGDVVITDLHNYGMPFVRYVTGDRAIAGLTQCGCGRGLPLLKKVIGRQLDMLTTLDGRQIPGEFFPHLVKDYPAVRRFQVIQDRLDEITLKLVVSSDWSDALCESLVTRIRATIGFVAGLNVELVDDIPLSPSGKLQVVVNRCGTGLGYGSPLQIP
jgi:phenylacetate-CoA ligase